LPTNLTDYDDPAIMELLAALTKWQDYASGVLVLIEIDETSAKARLDVAMARFTVAAEKGETVTLTKAKALLDPAMAEIKDELATLTAQRKAHEVMVEVFARDAAVVSREITRRTSSAGPNNRADRYTR
jgi:hypothetical protein